MLWGNRRRLSAINAVIACFFFPVDTAIILCFRNFNSLGLLRHLSRGGVDHRQDVHHEPREAHANSKVGIDKTFVTKGTGNLYLRAGADHRYPETLIQKLMCTWGWKKKPNEFLKNDCY